MYYNPNSHRDQVPSKGLLGRRESPKRGEIDILLWRRNGGTGMARLNEVGGNGKERYKSLKKSITLNSSKETE